MHDHHEITGTLATVYILANLIIVGGYVIVPFTLLGRRMPMTRPVRVAGIVFFATCAITHLSMALFWPLWWWLVFSHAIQAAAVWYFVLGFSRLIRDAQVQRRGPTDEPGRSGP